MNSKFFLFLTTIFFCSQLQPGGWISKEENPNDKLLIDSIDAENYNIFCTVLSEGECNINANIGGFWNRRTPMQAIITNHEKSPDCTDDCFHLKALRKLIEAGANINTLSSQLGTLIKNHVESNCTLNDCFHIEAFTMLVKAKANVNIFVSAPKDDPELKDVTLLHLAAGSYLPDFVRILVENGAELRAQAYFPKINEDGDTDDPWYYQSPLDLAGNDESPETAQLLAQYEEKIPGNPIYYTKRYVSPCSGSYPIGGLFSTK
jgi:hypothetical protein